MARPEVMERIRGLSQAAADDPTEERIRARLEWLMADPSTVTADLVAIRRAIYSRPGFANSMRHILCLQDPVVRQRNLITNDELEVVPNGALVVWNLGRPLRAGRRRHGHGRAHPGRDVPVRRRCRALAAVGAAGPVQRSRGGLPGRRKVVTARAQANAADRLMPAARIGRPCPPVRDLLPPGDVRAAYGVQQIVNSSGSGQVPPRSAVRSG